jgi:hypothetical protein
MMTEELNNLAQGYDVMVTALAALRAENAALQALLNDARGALQFILAFYEPGQKYLDTEAWKHAEAGGRRTLAALNAALADSASVQEKT